MVFFSTIVSPCAQWLDTPLWSRAPETEKQGQPASHNNSKMGGPQRRMVSRVTGVTHSVMAADVINTKRGDCQSFALTLLRRALRALQVLLPPT